MTPDAEVVALSDLENIRQQDLGTTAMSGRWVAQLASKTVGLTDPLQTAKNGTHVFYASDILYEHQSLRGSDNYGADIVLLKSTDYGKRRTYNGQALWVTFGIGNFESKSGVERWCVQRFPGRSAKALANVCAPRQLNSPS